MTRRLVLAAAFVFALVSSLPASAQNAAWTLDSSHSSAQFSVRHMMVSNVRGEFTKVTGTGQWNGKDFATASVDVTIDAASINTHDPKRDGHLKTADFFDVEKFPTITFKSTKVEQVSAGKVRMTGNLTMHGVTKSVVLNVDGPTPVVKDRSGAAHVGASATGTINRKDFGITWNSVLDGGGVMVSEEVSLTIDVDFVQKAGA
jgi:polyisoprenoid-binding protein YceI